MSVERKKEVGEDELESVVIETRLRVPEGAVKTYRNQRISLRSRIRCQGRLVFDSCVLEYGQDDEGSILLENGAALEMLNCRIVGREIADPPGEDDDPPVQLIQGEAAKCVSVIFQRCVFEGCGYFLAAGSEGKVIFECCQINQPMSHLVMLDYMTELEMTDCVVQFAARPRFSVFTGRQFGGYGLPFEKNPRIVNCRIEQGEPGAEPDEAEPCYFPLFNLMGAVYERCSICGMTKVIGNPKSIVQSEFKECTEPVVLGRWGSVEIEIRDSVFEGGRAALTNLNSGSRIVRCQFRGCLDRVLSGTGLTVSDCEFRGLRTDKDTPNYGLLYFDRYDEDPVSVLERSVFEDIELRESFIVAGSISYKAAQAGPAVKVKSCEFVNCRVSDPDGGLVRRHMRSVTDGLFKKDVVLELARTRNCRGIGDSNSRRTAVAVQPSKARKIGATVAAGAMLGVTGLALSAVIGRRL